MQFVLNGTVYTLCGYELTPMSVSAMPLQTNYHRHFLSPLIYQMPPFLQLLPSLQFPVTVNSACKHTNLLE